MNKLWVAQGIALGWVGVILYNVALALPGITWAQLLHTLQFLSGFVVVFGTGWAAYVLLDHYVVTKRTKHTP